MRGRRLPLFLASRGGHSHRRLRFHCVRFDAGARRCQHPRHRSWRRERWWVQGAGCRVQGSGFRVRHHGFSAVEGGGQPHRRLSVHLFRIDFAASLQSQQPRGRQRSWRHCPRSKWSAPLSRCRAKREQLFKDFSLKAKARIWPKPVPVSNRITALGAFGPEPLNHDGAPCTLNPESCTLHPASSNLNPIT